MIKKVLIIVLTLGLTVGAFGQSLEETLNTMLSDNAEMYTQPLGDGMGALMNSGYYHRSKVHKMLGFDLSVKLMALSVDEEKRFFDFSLADGTIEYDLSDLNANIEPISISLEDIYKDADTRVPNAAASTDSVGVIAVNDDHLVGVIEAQLMAQLTPSLGAPGAALAVSQMDIDGYVANIPDLLIPGLGLSTLILPMPQLAVGLPMGIELVVRGFPEYEIPDVGLFSMYGGGARLNIDQFIPIPLFPVDITAGAFFSQMTIGDIFESQNTSVNLQVGKSINLLVFGFGIYADAGYDMSSVNIKYTPDPDAGLGTDPIEFELETDPGMRVGLGLHIKPIPLVHVNLHAAQTPNNVVATAGLAISLR